MPRCCAGDRCNVPEVGLQGGPGGIKNCPDCSQRIHDMCAFEDEAAGLSQMNVCPDCWDARKPPAREPPARDDAIDEEMEEREEEAGLGRVVVEPNDDLVYQ